MFGTSKVYIQVGIISWFKKQQIVRTRTTLPCFFCALKFCCQVKNFKFHRIFFHKNYFVIFFFNLRIFLCFHSRIFIISFFLHPFKCCTEGFGPSLSPCYGSANSIRFIELFLENYSHYLFNIIGTVFPIFFNYSTLFSFKMSPLRSIFKQINLNMIYNTFIILKHWFFVLTYTYIKVLENNKSYVFVFIIMVKRKWCWKIIHATWDDFDIFLNKTLELLKKKKM